MPQTATPTRVTQSQLARLAGVSQMTVHNALNNNARVGPKTRRRVLQLALEKGYRLNAPAAAMRTGRTGTVALLMAEDDQRSALPRQMLYGLHAAVAQADMALNITIVPDDKLTDESFIPKVLREWHCDGLLINYNKNFPPHLQAILDQHAIPSVWLNHDADHDAARPDDFDAGVRATRQLLDLGHKAIWYVGYSYKIGRVHYSELERRDGYLQAMRAAGLPARAIDRYDPHFGHYRNCHGKWERALRASERPTAVICYGRIGLSIVHGMAQRVGLDVPGDLSLVTFSTEPVYNILPISAWMAPVTRVGQGGFEMLMEKIDRPGVMLPSRKYPFTLNPGGMSVGPAL